MISIIVACSKNGVIGKNNDLPWHIPDDLKRFKKLTVGNTVIMGRNTYASIIKRLGRPLLERRNIVISKILKNVNGVELARSLDDALELAKNDTDVFIIGGQQLYASAIKAGVVDKIFLTEIAQQIDGDTFFPKIDEKRWQEIVREEHKDKNFKYSFVILERVK